MKKASAFDGGVAVGVFVAVAPVAIVLAVVIVTSFLRPLVRCMVPSRAPWFCNFQPDRLRELVIPRE